MQFGLGAGTSHWSQFPAHRMVGTLVGDGVGDRVGDGVGNGVGPGVGGAVGEVVVVASAYCAHVSNRRRSMSSADVSRASGPGTCNGHEGGNMPPINEFQLRKFSKRGHGPKRLRTAEQHIP